MICSFIISKELNNSLIFVFISCWISKGQYLNEAFFIVPIVIAENVEPVDLSIKYLFK